MKYTKTQSVSGNWIKGKDVVSGTKCKLVSETTPVASSFTNKDGTPKNQDVAKIRFQNKDEVFNISINKVSINALIDAFGEDSVKWQGNVLTAITEKVIVGGKRQVALYLVPEGYELKESADGFMYVSKEGDEDTKEEKVVEVPEDELDPADIPF